MAQWNHSSPCDSISGPWPETQKRRCEDSSQDERDRTGRCFVPCIEDEEATTQKNTNGPWKLKKTRKFSP